MAGTFGQVWLVSRTNSDGAQTVYAMKIQSKYELCENGQARAVVHEKNIMAQLRHPFISDLAGSFQGEPLCSALIPSFG
jgi:serine/threonine protein kinase